MLGAFSFGDFTSSAQHNKSRPEYPTAVIRSVLATIGDHQRVSTLLDVGAGAGKLTQKLRPFASETIAVEPNDAMRQEGERLLPEVRWLKGTAEAIPVDSSTVDWVCMSNAFHFARQHDALSEFERVLRPGGFLTIVWHVPDLQHDERERNLQAFVNARLPSVRRTYLLVEKYMGDIENILQQGSFFEQCISISGQSVTLMNRQRYFDSWKAVHDIPSQITAGEWEDTLSAIEDQIDQYPERFPVTFRCYTFTVRSTKSEPS